MQSADRRDRRALYVVIGLGAVALGCIVAFMTIGVRGNWGFVLGFRGTKIAAMALVAYAVAISTVLFQTVTNNRILTPSIMGFDSLYLVLQTSLFFFLGSLETSRFDPNLRFLMEVVLMVGFSGLLYRWLFSAGQRSLHLLVLVGIIFGVMFRSLANFMQRLLDPNEFAVLQDQLFASFNTFPTQLLPVTAIILLVASIVAFRLLPAYDVLALGRDNAIGLGVDHRRTVSIILVVVAVMVSVSTALVGPITFFGLLVANLAYHLAGTHKHAYVLPIAALLAVIALIGGQLVVERVFGFDTALSIVIEFVGGVTFIALLLRGVIR